MPLTHAVLTLACVVAAATAVALSRDSVSRAAHVVMTLAMIVMPLSTGATAAAAGALGVLALLLAHHRRGRCAVDAAACAVLLVLGLGFAANWGGPTGGPGHADAAMAGMPGMHAAALPTAGQLAVRLLLALVVVVAWQVLRRRTAPSGRRGSTLAAWVMLVTMGAMSIAV